MLKILGRSSSINVRKVLWLCAELDLPFEQEMWGAGSRSTAEPEFLALNPGGLIPVVCDGDFVLWESNAICRYLTAKQDRNDLLPEDLQRKALVEQWMDWTSTELNGAWRYAFLGLVRKNPACSDAAAIAASIESWNRLMGIVDAHLAKTGAYITGKDFTLADIVLGLATHRWKLSPIKRPDYPALAAYYERLCRRPAFQSQSWGDTP